MKTFHHVKDFLKENIHKYILGIIVLIIVDILQLVMPKILGNITDLLIANRLTRAILYKYIGIILIVALGIALCRFSWRLLIIGTSRKMEYWLRNKFFSHLELLSLTFFNNNKTGDLMAHATSDILAVRMAFGPGIVMATDSFFLTIATIIMMLINIEWKLTLVALAPLPIITIIIILFGHETQKRYKLVQESISELTNDVQESLSGIRVIKAFVQEEKELNKFLNFNKSVFHKNMKLVKLSGLTWPTVTFISSISFIIALFYGGNLVINETISLGQLVSFITYLGLLTWPMTAIGNVINMLHKGIASMKRLNNILDTEPEIKDGENMLDVDSMQGTITFNDLTFTYPGCDTPALKNIDLTIEAGKTLAIIGKTGSGKSTLVNLILRLYNLEDNKVLIDNRDINTIPLNTLRKNIGVVPQDNFLFSYSIKDNIAFYHEYVTEDNIVKACTVSQIHDEIKRLPDSFNTKLGERGVNLSGGQKQRISISRAIIKDPKVLILDDSLSAVDTNTEENILRYLKDEMKNRTSIIIAHRISTIKDADQIIVMDKGEIIQRGTHEKLIKEEGLYRELYEKQQLSDQLDKEA